MGLLFEVILFGLGMLGVGYWIRSAKDKPVTPQVSDKAIIDELEEERNEGHPNDGDFS